jgi:hypothetical protein
VEGAAGVSATLGAPADLITLPRLASIKTRDGWMAKCPAHEDRARSLSLRLGDDGRLLLHCFAGCRASEIVAALGLELRDLFPGNTGSPPRPRSTRRRPDTRSPLDQARVEVLLEGRRQAARRAPYLALYAEADTVRLGFQIATRARQLATRLGDTAVSWELLAGAADVEREAFSIEAELDLLLEAKRLP